MNGSKGLGKIDENTPLEDLVAAVHDLATSPEDEYVMRVAMLRAGISHTEASGLRAMPPELFCRSILEDRLGRVRLGLQICLNSHHMYRERSSLKIDILLRGLRSFATKWKNMSRDLGHALDYEIPEHDELKDECHALSDYLVDSICRDADESGTDSDNTALDANAESPEYFLGNMILPETFEIVAKDIESELLYVSDNPALPLMQFPVACVREYFNAYFGNTDVTTGLDLAPGLGAARLRAHYFVLTKIYGAEAAYDRIRFAFSKVLSNIIMGGMFSGAINDIDFDSLGDMIESDHLNFSGTGPEHGTQMSEQLFANQQFKLAPAVYYNLIQRYGFDGLLTKILGIRFDKAN